MKSNTFLTKCELLDQSNAIKRKQKRLIQVRQQSKEMSAAILERVKREAKKQNEDIENRVLAEIRNYHSKELASRREQYEKCISEINQQHYLRQINLNNTKRSICSRKKFTHSTTNVDKAQLTNFHQQKENNEEYKRVLKKPSSTSIAEASPKNNCDKMTKNEIGNSFKLPRNIVIDSDEEKEKSEVAEFGQNVCSLSPKIKYKTLTSRNEVQQRCDHRKNLLLQNSRGTKILDSIAEDNNLIKNNEIMKTEIDQMYNHLVHDRIRILEQKDKILSRQTRFLRDATTNQSPRFSEYFVQHYDKTFSSIPGCDLSQKNTTKNESQLNEIVDDMKRVELKKKLLKEELTNSENKVTSKVIAPKKDEKLDNANGKSNSLIDENPLSSCSTGKKSESSTGNDEPLKKSPRNKICPSPIPKPSNVGDTNPCEVEKRPKLTRHRHCKRKLRSDKEVVVTVSNKEAVRANFSSLCAKQNHSSGLSSTENDQIASTTKSPVKVIVRVLSTADCKIEIKNNDSNKRHVQTESKKKNAVKVNNWRTLFKNEEKLTESSYYSPPECYKKLQPFPRSAKPSDKIISLSSDESVNDMGYYIRKLLLMSPESIDNLDVSSCNTTVENQSTSTSVANSIDISYPRREQFQEISTNSHATESRLENEASRIHDSTIESENDPEYIRQILLKCLKLATSNDNNLKLPSFKSTNSTRDYKTFDNYSNETDTVGSNLLYAKILNTTIQRLLPLYHNSLDDNIDITTPSTTANIQHIKEFLDQTIDESEADVSPDEEEARFSTSAYLEKLLSTLPLHSRKQNERDKIDHTTKTKYAADSTNAEQRSLKSYDLHSNDQNNVSLPSINELIEKGLISKTYALVESSKNGEEKEFIDEEEFIKKMLTVDAFAKEKSPQEVLDPSDNRLVTVATLSPEIPTAVPKDTSSSDIRKELRLLGLNWMDTTLQRTLQASAINSTSSAEESVDALRNIPTLSDSQFNYVKSSPLLCDNLSQRTSISISPITVPDVQLNIPEYLR